MPNVVLHGLPAEKAKTLRDIMRKRLHNWPLISLGTTEILSEKPEPPSAYICTPDNCGEEILEIVTCCCQEVSLPVISSRFRPRLMRQLRIDIYGEPGAANLAECCHQTLKNYGLTNGYELSIVPSRRITILENKVPLISVIPMIPDDLDFAKTDAKTSEIARKLAKHCQVQQFFLPNCDRIMTIWDRTS